MTCQEAESLVLPFMKDELSLQKSEAFIHHVKGCPACMEELEVTFVLYTALYQLEGDTDFSGNYTVELRRKLEALEAKIRKGKRRRINRLLFLFSFLLVISAMTGFRQPDKRIPQRQEGLAYHIPIFLEQKEMAPDQLPHIKRLQKGYMEVYNE